MNKGVFVAFAVLFLLTAPVALADIGVRSLPDQDAPAPPSEPPRLRESPDVPTLPDEGSAPDATDHGQDEAQDSARRAEQAREDAEAARAEAERALKEAAAQALADLDETATDGQQDAQQQLSMAAAIIFGIISGTQDAADQIVTTITDLLFRGQDPAAAAAPPRSGLDVRTQSLAGPAPDPTLAAVVLVVAAGAVGGALLWWAVLQRAVLFGLVPMLSRISRGELYTNDARRLIADLVQGSPGVSLNELVQKTSYSRNAVSYHLFVLEKEEELISIKDGKYRRYFPRGGKYVNGAKNVVSALRNDTTLKMAQTIAARPGLIQRELCKDLGTTPSAACWHARRLEDLKIIRKERVANTVQYFPGEALQKYDLAEFGLPSAGPGSAPAPAAHAAPGAI